MELSVTSYSDCVAQEKHRNVTSLKQLINIRHGDAQNTVSD
ncbi:hypothetical protein W5M_06507 [Corynebacterium diphtheriae bv. intermedius str. NCTC 5011]|nr:hypothetical protein W5M_06507 [Corynebacterium diphtheriae bv. intermedius str. NCTC 5011]